MRKKIKLKKRRSFISNIDKIVLLISVIIIFLFFILKYINKKISPVLLGYAKMEAEKISSIIATASLNREMMNELNVDNLFITTKNTDGKILTIDFDPIIVNEILTSVTVSIQQNLKRIEEGDIDNLTVDKNTLLNYDYDSLTKGIFYYLPIGIIFNNTLLANTGPKIPIKLSLVGNVLSDIESKVKNYGLNNALVEISINLTLTEKVILPIISDTVKINVRIPLAIKIIQGSVPEYYYNGVLRSNETVLKMD